MGGRSLSALRRNNLNRKVKLLADSINISTKDTEGVRVRFATLYATGDWWIITGITPSVPFGMAMAGVIEATEDDEFKAHQVMVPFQTVEGRQVIALCALAKACIAESKIREIAKKHRMADPAIVAGSDVLVFDEHPGKRRLGLHNSMVDFISGKLNETEEPKR